MPILSRDGRPGRGQFYRYCTALQGGVFTSRHVTYRLNSVQSLVDWERLIPFAGLGRIRVLIKNTVAGGILPFYRERKHITGGSGKRLT